MKLEDKVAVITGATRGIGACMAQRFAAEGATVVIAGRNAERGDRLPTTGRPRHRGLRHGAYALTRQVAFDYSPHNIRCNCIIVGLVVNEFSGASVPNAEAEAAFRSIQFTRLGRNDDIAGMALYMAGNGTG